MSVVTRNPDGSLNYGSGTVNGRPGQIQQQPAQADPIRQSVMNQLGQQPGAPPQTAGEPRPTNMGAFARGGQVTQLPGMDTQRLANTGIGVGSQVAGKVLANSLGNAATQGATQGAKTGMSATSFGSGATGAATSMGIGLATGAIADKLRVKEEMPTFGGEFGHLTDEYGRRFEGTGGGVASNAVRYAGYGSAAGPIGMAVGAGIGALVGGLTKNAPSAYTDFRVEDASQAIDKAFQEYYGRPATEDEIKSALVGQGWDEQGGDRWTGEKSLNYILGQIKQNGATEQQQRAALMGQLGSGGAQPETSAPTGATAITGSASGAAPSSTGPVDPSGWNTDGYAAPKVTAQNVRGQAPAGWDQKKWDDPNHQTPKYVWGRITQDDNPNDVQQLLEAYPGAQFDGKDKVTGIPGLGPIDIYKGASVGENTPQWLDINADAGAAKGPQATTGGPLQASDLSDPKRMAEIQAELERILAGQPPREALLSQLGATNG